MTLYAILLSLGWAWKAKWQALWLIYVLLILSIFRAVVVYLYCHLGFTKKNYFVIPMLLR